MCNDLWKEHEDAVEWDYIWGIGVPEGCEISCSEFRRGMIAISDLGVRAREVRDNPAAFSKYTVEFVNFYEQTIPDKVNKLEALDIETFEVPF